MIPNTGLISVFIREMKEAGEFNPIRVDIDVKASINIVDNTKTQRSEKPNDAPNLVFMVRLPGPKTKAAVIIPGPKLRISDLKDLLEVFSVTRTFSFLNFI